MPDIEHDMDDLFQRAAENYPLQTGDGDWESIAKKLAAKPGEVEKKLPFPKKNNKKLIVSGLLLLLLTAGWLMFQDMANKRGYGNNAPGLTKDNRNGFNKAIIENNNDTISTKTITTNTTLSGETNNGLYKKRLNRATSNASAKITIAGGDAYFDTNQNMDAPGGIAKDYHTDFFPGEYLKENGSEGFLQNLQGPKIKIVQPGNTVNEILSNGPGKNELPASTQKKKDKTQLKLHEDRGFYAGIAAGPDFSKVASGPFNHSGFDGGVLVGYNLNNKISFESGIVWNNKNYRSEGSYFSMDKVRSTMPAGMIINNLYGKSSMIEIPLKARYNLIFKRKATLFAAAGVSAYIITEEKNNYNVTMNSSQENLTGVYEKNVYSLPAAANISAGYERSVSKNLRVRIEPFLKIPLQGIGIGSLQVTSAGLQVGITTRL